MTSGKTSKQIERVIKTRGMENAGATFLAKNGKEIPILISTNLLRDDYNTVMGIVLVARDITEHINNIMELESSREILKQRNESMEKD